MRLFYLLIAGVSIWGCGRAPEDRSSAESDPIPPPQVAAPSTSSVPADDRPVIVAFGDSLSAGLGADPGKSYPDYLQQDLDRLGLRYRVVNAGISGDTTSGGLSRVGSVV